MSSISAGAPVQGRPVYTDIFRWKEYFLKFCMVLITMLVQGLEVSRFKDFLVADDQVVAVVTAVLDDSKF